ncbi:hypothetical protein BJX96DRAFT_101681 [Aspergillus floccosus]
MMPSGSCSLGPRQLERATRGPASSPMRFSTHCYHYHHRLRLSRSLCLLLQLSVLCTSGLSSCQLIHALLPGVIGWSEHASLPGFRHPKIRTRAPPTKY